MEQLLKDLEEIQNKIEGVSKLKLTGQYTGQQVAGEIKSLTLKAGRIALNFYNDSRPQKELNCWVPKKHSFYLLNYQ